MAALEIVYMDPDHDLFRDHGVGIAEEREGKTRRVYHRLLAYLKTLVDRGFVNRALAVVVVAQLHYEGGC